MGVEGIEVGTGLTACHHEVLRSSRRARVGLGELEFEQVGAPGEVQRRGLGERAGSGFEEIGDVVAGERAIVEGIVEGAGGGLGAVGLTERDDFAHVMDRIEATLLELAVVLVGAGGQRDEALEQALGGGLAALFEQGAGVVGVLEVAVSLVASRMRICAAL